MSTDAPTTRFRITLGPDTGEGPKDIQLTPRAPDTTVRHDVEGVSPAASTARRAPVSITTCDALAQPLNPFGAQKVSAMSPERSNDL